RWTDHSPLRLERRAYFPFLTGPKFCVGSHFALLEATEAVERFLARFDHEMLDPEPPWGREFALSFAPDRRMPCRLARR
ncbi:MAG: cytochrome P450, partial [Acidimicrobiaceae bacterium]|nr:cytochrome P450 [Acidimicrobiaceae bacterium]